MTPVKRQRKSMESQAAGQGTPSDEEVRRAVRERYSKLATQDVSCCGPSSSTSCGCGKLYPNAEILSLPQDAISVSAGCGNPTAIASLKPGMTVVDLGSGGGIDVFLAAKKVGPQGKVYGIDATPEMIYRARTTAKESGYENVEFRLGEIEHMPLDSNVADVVISNCVINLAPDKGRVFEEAFRVLRPGGKLAVSDIVLLKDLPESIRNNLRAWSECVSGAISEEEYLGAIERAGFEKIKVEDRVIYTHDDLVSHLNDSIGDASSKLKGVDLSQIIGSYRISARKPNA